MEYILAIDIGTTYLKAATYDFSGKLHSIQSTRITTNNPKTGYFEQDADMIFAIFIDVVNRIIKELNSPPEAMVFSAAMHSLLAIDQNNKPLIPAMIWQDTRSKSFSNAHKDQLDLFFNTGTPIYPMSPLFKILWIKTNAPEVFNNAFKFISVKEYIILKLCGVYVVDHSIASATGLLNLNQLNWDSNAMGIAGISTQHLSDVRPINYQLPFIKDKYANQLKINPKSPVYIGGSDGCLANIGGNILSKNQALISLGTSAAIRTTVKRPIPDDKMRVFNYVLDDENFVFGGASSNAGNVIEWFESNYLSQQDKSIFQLAEQANDVDPSLMFSPYLFGERTPFWDPDLTGGFMVKTENYNLETLSKCVLESLAINIHSIFCMVEELVGKFEEITLNGGLTRSKYFCQLLADIFNRELKVIEMEDNSVKGAAMIAAMEMGIIENYSQWQAEHGSFIQFIPNFTAHEKYIPKIRNFHKSITEITR